MARQKLTKMGVESMKPAPEELVVWDSALPGFGLAPGFPDQIADHHFEPWTR